MLSFCFNRQRDKKFTFNSGEKVLPDVSEDEFASNFEYAAVFKLDDEEKPSSFCKRFVKDLQKSNIEMFFYKSVQHDELIILIRAPLSKLKRYADHSDFKLAADPMVARVLMETGDAENRIRGVVINDDKQLCVFDPYDHCFLAYEEDADQRIYGGDDAFDKLLRLKLTYNLLRGPKIIGGLDFAMEKFIKEKRMLAFYPLHDKKTNSQLLDYIYRWSVFPWDSPIEDMRQYFGEKVALYNAFLAHYSLWLIWPSIIGITFQLVVWGTLDFSHPVLPFFALLISLWSVLMLEFWKREESYFSLFWGTTDYEEKEQDRPQFEGDIIPSHINGRMMAYYPQSKASSLWRISAIIVSVFLSIVIGTVAAIYVFRFYLQTHSSTSSAASTIASIINTIQITLFNMIYQKLAIILTDLENHRTDTQYDDSLTIKLFVFQFINSFASFFFIAFIASNLDRPENAPSDYLGQCGATNCMQPLSINLAIIFGSRLTITNFLDIFLPWFFHQWKIKSEKAGVEEGIELTPAEQDYVLMPYDNHLESIRNYADTVIQYGFTVLFITALPCATFFSLISNYVKVKLNAWKIIKLYQRPVPSGAQDIGTWQIIFRIMTSAAVLTNAGLICFTMDVLWRYSIAGRIWVFIGFQWVLMTIQFIFEVAIADIPEDVEIQMQRMKFIEDKIIHKSQDDDFDINEETQRMHRQKSTLAASNQPICFWIFGILCGCCCCQPTPKEELSHDDDNDDKNKNDGDDFVLEQEMLIRRYPKNIDASIMSLQEVSMDLADTHMPMSPSTV